MPAVLKLVDAQRAGRPEFEQARPYLDAYDVIAYGFEGDDDGGAVRAWWPG